MTEYETEPDYDPEDYVYREIFIALIITIIFVFANMLSSCKAPKQATAQAKIQKMQPSKFVYDKDEINEVMPKQKD